MKKRPIDLKLTAIYFPVTAVVSIMHRLAGLALVALIPLILWLFYYVMEKPSHFNKWLSFIHSLWGSLLLWVLFATLSYHLLAGIRHLLMDMGLGESLRAGRFSAKLVLLIWLISIVGLAFVLCQGVTS